MEIARSSAPNAAHARSAMNAATAMAAVASARTTTNAKTPCAPIRQSNRCPQRRASSAPTHQTVKWVRHARDAKAVAEDADAAVAMDAAHAPKRMAHGLPPSRTSKPSSDFPRRLPVWMRRKSSQLPATARAKWNSVLFPVSSRANDAPVNAVAASGAHVPSVRTCVNQLRRLPQPTPQRPQKLLPL